MKFLTDIEIKDLIEVIEHEDTKQAVKLCLSTSARCNQRGQVFTFASGIKYFISNHK